MSVHLHFKKNWSSLGDKFSSSEITRMDYIKKNSQYMIFLYKCYNLLRLHQQKFNHTSFETVLSLYEMKINL